MISREAAKIAKALVSRPSSRSSRLRVQKNARGPVSRVLYSPSVTESGDHSSRTKVALRLQRPTRTTSRNVAHMPSLFGLAPGGVYRAGPVARTAVRSCRTLSTLPVRSRAVCFLWHCPSPPKEWPGVTRHRCSVEPGLSSPPLREPRSPGPLARAAYRKLLPSLRAYRSNPVFSREEREAAKSRRPFLRVLRGFAWIRSYWIASRRSQ
jgi:hypothetical protein